MTSPASDEERCPTCGNTRKWHEENRPRHAFGGKIGQPVQRPVVKTAPWPFDPVLRQALINKGVLTPEDLSKAEDQIRAVTAQYEARLPSMEMMKDDSGDPSRRS